MKSYTVYLIRHGMTDEGGEGRYIGHTDVPLSEEGRQQLIRLKDELVYPPVSAVFTSPLSRCTETAAILYPENKAIAIDGLIEYDFGEFENKTAEELKKSPVFPKWLAGEADPPFGESNAAFAKRVCGSFEKILEGLMKTGTTDAAIVTHARRLRHPRAAHARVAHR